MDATTVTIDKGLEVLLRSVSDRGKKRGDARFRYTTTFQGDCEAVLVFAIERLTSQWDSADATKPMADIGRAVRAGRALTPNQVALLQQMLIPVKK